VTVSAGPTREAFDPVRFVSNRSSGRMGYALAAAAWELGADVTLVHGPTGLDAPPGVRMVPVTTAREMADAVRAHARDVLVMSAAVADWRPVDVSDEKRKKGDDWAPSFERTEDILATLSDSIERPAVVIGFAAETQHHLDHGRDKLARKRLDGIVVNDVGGPDGAFDNATNAVTLLAPGRDPVDVPRASKREVAHSILEWVRTEVLP
jgi:phosphopantothenoylcysteine synthetase/decarboxylase